MSGSDRKTELRVAVLMAIAGCILLGCGFMFPPKGEIHSSVLVAFGEILTVPPPCPNGLTFAGALFGIDYHYRREGR